jgi:hypothetical protein
MPRTAGRGIADSMTWSAHPRTAPIRTPGWPMLDVLYVAGTIAFFAVMLAFVAGCARIIGTREEDCTPGGLDDAADSGR